MDQLRPAQITQPAALTVLFAAALVALVTLITRSYYKAVLLVSPFLVLFLSYGYIYSYIGHLMARTPWYSNRDSFLRLKPCTTFSFHVVLQNNLKNGADLHHFFPQPGFQSGGHAACWLQPSPDWSCQFFWFRGEQNHQAQLHACSWNVFCKETRHLLHLVGRVCWIRPNQDRV